MRGRDGDPWLLALAGLDALIALLAVWGGLELAVGAAAFQLPTEWIAPLGLRSWLLPGIALIALIGGPMAVAAVASWQGIRHAAATSIAAGVILLGWLALQFVLFGLQVPVQIITAVLALAVVSIGVVAARTRHV
ncbi:hypothetical protein [Kutzneria buriramensis]|uniref:Uncharacterized protein n=1 Tax=Kutzneria buriramensis TaxID=1045776 RepID=A0A3E0H044_9PSEU|nr:hypothetical protein [Kutzneria buriramensis]REH34800.1 hypothetical protein BCF44_11976 [Kutzneria buriramensis]